MKKNYSKVFINLEFGNIPSILTIWPKKYQNLHFWQYLQKYQNLHFWQYLQKYQNLHVVSNLYLFGGENGSKKLVGENGTYLTDRNGPLYQD